MVTFVRLTHQHNLSRRGDVNRMVHLENQGGGDNLQMSEEVSRCHDDYGFIAVLGRLMPTCRMLPKLLK